jgi:hypothetical protein
MCQAHWLVLVAENTPALPQPHWQRLDDGDFAIWEFAEQQALGPNQNPVPMPGGALWHSVRFCPPL